MSLKIDHGISFSKGLKSKIEEQCTVALKLIDNKATSDPHHVIHEVRKAFKKIRAALRLIRDHVDFYKNENVFFRDQGRRISDVRDAASVIEGLDLVYEQYSEQLYNKTFNEFHNFLQDRRQQLLNQPKDIPAILSSIRADLLKKKSDINEWQLAINDFETIYPSVKRVYERGRKAYIKAKETHHPDDFHEWRKRVKYLRYQLDLLNRIWPSVLNTWEDELHNLSDYLGDDRDLLMLADVADQNKSQFAQSSSYQLLMSLIASHRSKIQKKALLLGSRSYYLKSDDFTGLLQSSWQAYNSENSLQYVKS